MAPLRIVQWTTGNVGRRSVIAITANPGLELVGCFAWEKTRSTTSSKTWSIF